MAKRQLALSVLAMAMIAGSITASAAAKVLVQQGMVGVDESTRLERVPGTTRLSLAIGLPLRNQPELAALRLQLHDPASPNYHRWLTPEEFTAQFGPTQEDYSRLQAWMKAKGLKVTQTHANRLVLNVEGSVANIEKALNVHMHNYEHRASGAKFHAPDRDPSLDIDVEVANVHGLNNLIKPVPRLKKADLAAVAHAGSGTGGTYIGKDFRAAYANGVASTLTGTGQGIALFEFSNYYAVDPANYWKDAGMTAPALTNVGAATANSGNGNNAYFGQDEVSLDIEIAGALAPGAHLYVYAGDDSYTILNRIVSDNICKQVGVSWGWATNAMTTQTSIDTTEDAIYQQMDTQGISVFVAAGDSGTWTTSQWGQSTSSSSFNPIHPADGLYVTCVGGTNLSTSSASGPWSSENVWSSGGGGYSHRYSIPTWQSGVNWSSISGASTLQRNCPDVAAIASNVYVDSGNGTKGQNYGGTSCAAPLWAAFTALANQYAQSVGKPVIGFLNPALYTIGKGAGYATSMHDVKSGSDGLPAATGFDMATGWGTPNGQATISALVGINDAPSVSASITTPAANVTITSGTAQSFTGTAIDSNPSATLAYSWNFGDGGSATTATATHTYTNTGTASVAYTATFRVTDNTGATSSATRVITVNPISSPAITLSPATVTLARSATQQFTATVTGTTNTAVTWTATGGSISSTGLYTAPATAGTYTVKATSVADTTKSASATVTVSSIQPQLILNPGFESGSTSWTGTTGDIGTWTGEPAHNGTKNCWLDGNGSSATESIQQTVAIPSGITRATLSFWLHIDTAETTSTTAYDTLKIQVINGTTTTTLATYSNLNKATGYTQKSFDLSAYAGKTVTLKFLGVEDSSLQTSFVIDDVSLAVQ